MAGLNDQSSASEKRLIPVRSAVSCRSGPIFNLEARNPRHLLQIRRNENSIFGKSVRCNCGVEIFDPLSTLFKCPLDRSEALTHRISPVSSSQLEPNKIETALQKFSAFRSRQLFNAIGNF